MSVLFIITLALLGTIAYAIYRKQHTDADGGRELEPIPGRGLFVEEDETARPEAVSDGREARQGAARSSLLARAVAGDKSALAEARQFNDAGFYRTILGALVGACGSSTEKLQALAESIPEDGELRGSVVMTEAYGRLWEQSPDRLTTARAFHLAALADDAAAFGAVVDRAARLWRGGRLSGMRAGELSGLIESEYWVLSSAARASGDGFVLKRTISSLRSELAAHD